MRYDLRYSPAFLEDLYQIADYIETQFHDPSAADRITDGIVSATDILANFPETGKRVYLPGGLDSGYRFVVFEHFLAIYQIRFQEVYIVRAVSEKQDYMRVLFPWLKQGPSQNE